MDKPKKKVIVYWCRRDFRFADNSALHASIKETKRREENTEKYFLPVFVLEDYMLEASSKFQFGYPSRFFLAQAIPEFAKHFNNFLLVSGKGAQTFIDLKKYLNEKFEENIDFEIHVNEDVYVDFYRQIQKLKQNEINVKVYVDQLTVNKETVSGTGNFYSVFTPFKKAVWDEFMASIVIEKADLKNLEYLNDNVLGKFPNKIEIVTDKIWDLFSKTRTIKIVDPKTNNKHKIDIDELLDFKPELSSWYFTEADAKKRMKSFVKDLITDYKENRDSLEKDASGESMLDGKTSRLSLALAWGLITAREIKKEIQEVFDEDFINVSWFDKNISSEREGILSYLSELVWREFYKYLLFNNPKLMNEEFQERFKFKIDWVEESEAVKRFEAWIKGETGYKIVDAAMMQLAKTGWMHNRSRMIVASVLTKNLGVDWRWGQEYFRAMLIDLDEASNNGGWQWGASVGADPKPIRIFNPYLQAENYDQNNLYQKKWLGEKFEVEIEPIVEHKQARAEALKRYGLDKTIKDESIRDY